MRYRDIARRLKKLGCRELRQGKGSHRIWINPETGQVATVPDWGSKDLAPVLSAPSFEIWALTAKILEPDLNFPYKETTSK